MFETPFENAKLSRCRAEEKKMVKIYDRKQICKLHGVLGKE